MSFERGLLTEPFILRDAEQGRPSCSQAFYQLYLNAAGYHVEESEQDYFELSPGADKARLKEQYLGTIGENRWERIRTGHQFDAFMRLLEGTSCHELERNYEHFVAFLSQQEGMLERVQKMRPHFTAPEVLPEHETVITGMLENGLFIDRAHFEMVLALHDEKASLDFMEQAALSGTPGTGAVFQQPAQEMHQAYQEYLVEQEAPFYHFMDEQGLRTRFGRPNFHTIGCSQTVLCQWLRETQQLSAAIAQKLAVLCVKGGYASAITLLCGREDVSADYVDRQEHQSLLAMAADNGHIETVRALIVAGADVNLQSRDRETALMRAARYGHAETVRALIVAGADVKLQDLDGQTALMFAAMRGHIDIVRALLAAGADVKLEDGEGETALMRAAMNGHTDIVRSLLAAEADVTLQSRYGETALISAARYGHAETVRALLAAGADVNLQGSFGETALISAARSGQIDIIRDLLAAGADVKLEDGEGETALMRAADNDCLDTIRALIGAGATAREQDIPQAAMLMEAALTGRQAFLEALMSGNIEMIRTSIADGANVNRLSDGRNALDVAIQSGSLAMVREVLASERLAPWVIINALKGCVENREHHTEMLPLLLAHGDTVQLIIQNGHQKAPLAWAAEHQCVAAVQAFIEAGAPLSESHAHGETALTIAQRLGNQEIIVLLSGNQSLVVESATSAARINSTLYSGRERLSASLPRESVASRSMGS